MKFLKILVAAVFLLAAGSAVADKGGPIITGVWAGAGQAMYVDGTSAEIVSVFAELYQEGYFFSGLAVFEVTVGGVPQLPQFAQMSGHISGNAIKGVLGGCIPPAIAPNCAGAAILEGKLSGNKLSGTVVDLSDGSTSVITLHRLAD
jgi:hypothetical protein